MVFWEFMVHVLSLDIAWLINFVMNNLLWIFMFTAVIYILQSGKNVILGLITTIIIVFITSDLVKFYNLAIYTAIGLSILYLFRLVILTSLEHTPKLAGFLKLGWFLSFYIILYLYNVFLV